MNIALTYTCNQDCAYCFGRDAMRSYRGRPSQNELSFENLKKVLAFMKRSCVSEFRMIGGEPTLHPRFKELYESISKEGFSVMIFSNGVIKKDIVDFLSEKSNLSAVLLNIRTPHEYRASDWEKIRYALLRLNKSVMLSFRIYRLDFDARFLFDLIGRYHLQKFINWAIACPSLSQKNEYIRLEDHEKVVDRMIGFSEESKGRDIKWVSDSGYIWCAFSGGKAQLLKERVDFVPETNCFPALEVGPDLRVMRCYGMASMSRKRMKITDFESQQAAERYFFERSLPLKRIGAIDKCFACEHLASQRCGGGCMVHILKRFPGYRHLPKIF